MPTKQQREVRRAKELGYKGEGSYVWIACPDCNKERWVQCSRIHRRCHSCAGRARRNPNHKYTNPDGFVIRWVSPENPYRPMTNTLGYTSEHRLIMAQHLGRCLETTEVVHHINHIRDDNRIENLIIMTAKEHTCKAFQELRDKIIGLQQQLQEKEEEIDSLKWQLLSNVN